MYALSSRYKAAIIAGTSGMSAKATLWAAGSQTGTVNVVDGSVTVARSAAQRRVCSLQIAFNPGDANLPAADGSGNASPFGAEIQPSFGIDYGDGTSEYIPMGVFAITDLVLTDNVQNLTGAVTGSDRSFIVAERKLLVPYTVTSGANVGAAAAALINSVYPGLTYNIGLTTAVAPTPGPTFAENSDPWAAALQMLTDGAGFATYFDLAGTCTSLPTPDPTTQPVVWDFSEGSSCVVTNYVRTLTRKGVTNYFVVTASGSKVQPPVQSIVQNTDPLSPTRVASNFGTIPQFIASSLALTTTDCTNVGNNAAIMAKGLAEVLTISIPPNPAFDIDDVVYLKRARIGVNGYYVIDAVTHSLRFNGSTVLTLRRVK